MEHEDDKEPGKDTGEIRDLWKNWNSCDYRTTEIHKNILKIVMENWWDLLSFELHWQVWKSLLVWKTCKEIIRKIDITAKQWKQK